MPTASLQTILLVDDNADLGRNLKRLAEPAFPSFQLLWVRNGIAALEAVRQHAETLRLVVLDIDLPLMDGNATAVQIRELVPAVPVMPFTAREASLPALVEMGCVLPVVKRPETLPLMPDLMRLAMCASVIPLPELPWITALRQSGDAVLSFIKTGTIADMLITDGSTAVNVQRALTHLNRYCHRIAKPPAREIQQARKALQGVIGD